MKIDFKNKSFIENVRVKVVPKNDSLISKSDTELNPTVGINNGELSFCLSPLKTFECLGNSSTAIATGSFSGKYEITINDINYPPLSLFFPDRPEIDGVRVFLDISQPITEMIDRLHFQNLSSEIKRVVVKLIGDEINTFDYFQKLDTENNEIEQIIEYSDYVEGFGYKQISFCLRSIF